MFSGGDRRKARNKKNKEALWWRQTESRKLKKEFKMFSGGNRQKAKNGMK